VLLLIAGPGEDLFTRFGHAALVVREGSSGGRVYNYGFTDFAAPDLVFSFLRGKARFWVARLRFDRTLEEYRRADRDLHLVPLRLRPEQHLWLARALEENRRPENRYYIYHHFNDNCATRLRDLIDQVLGGGLRREFEQAPSRTTLRALVREGFAGRLEMLLAADLILGRAMDRPLDRWQGAFLPRLLEEALRDARASGASLIGERQMLHRRQQPSPLAHDPLAGLKLLWAFAMLTGLLAAGAALLARRRSRWTGALLVGPALFLGSAGLLLDFLALYSALPELRANELLLLLWPVDLFLIWPTVRWLRGRLWAGRVLRLYAWIKIGASGLAVLGHLTGLLYQEPRAWLAMVALSSAGLFLTVRALPRRAVQGDRAAITP